MINRRLLRATALSAAFSLIISAPGFPAWSAAASYLRPVSVKAVPSASLSSVSSPLLLNSAGGMSVSVSPSLAPSLSLSAPSVAVAAPALAAPALAAPEAVAAPRAQLSALAHAAASAPSDKGGSPLGRFGEFFDGLIARRPAQDAMSVPGEEGSGAPRLNPHGKTLVPVLLTVADPGTLEGLTLVLAKLKADHGVRYDQSFEPVRAPGQVTVRAGVPVASLLAVKKAPGVIEMAAATGTMQAAPDAPREASAAPESESLLRSGLRKLLVKNPALGAVAMLPLHFAVAVAFMGPVMGGIALGGEAAILKPFMLATAAGMAATFSFLAPLAKRIPMKIRATLTVGALVMLSTAAISLPGMMPLGYWLLANTGLTMFAVASSAERLDRPAVAPLTKALNSTEAAALLNLIGYQALVPILILAGSALAPWVLGVSTILGLSVLLTTSRAPSPAAVAAAQRLIMSAGPGSVQPSGEPEAPKPEAPQPAKRKAAKTREPFVPATKVVADLEALAKNDPVAAFKAADALLKNPKERRTDAKIGAHRVLESLPVALALPAHLDLLKTAAGSGVQTSKELNSDPWWYLQRQSLNRVARDAAALAPASAELLDALKASFKDRNPSVRLAAAEALRAFGVEPGEEPVYRQRVETPQPGPEARAKAEAEAKAKTDAQKKGGFLNYLMIGMLVASLWMMFNKPVPPQTPPATPPAVEQVVPADAAKTAPGVEAPKPTAEEKNAATLEQIAKDTKRNADAAERQAEAFEKMATPKSGLSSFLGTIFNFLLIGLVPILLLFWLFRKFGGMGGMGLKTKPTMNLERPTTKFSDVAGIDESMVEVQEILDFLNEPQRFRHLGARMPKGVLLEGPPGTGKTLLAKALAGETNAAFISISGSDFVELFVGMGARRVRELFEHARQNSPAIIFIDEIDAVGKQRGNSPAGGGNDEREQTINQLLKEMDGFDNSSGIIVVAATNQANTLDTALTRPGRFDRKIHVGLPEMLGREAILSLHARQARLAAGVDLRLIARRAAGLSGAFLQNIVNEAALLAARRGADSISAADIDEAVDRATIGGKRSLRLSEPLKRRIAAHEAGHVLANLLNEKADLRVPVNKVTIIPHGSGALGFAETGSEEGDRYLYTKSELEARLDTALGGLVAEKLFYGEWSSGPDSDLKHATRIARAMVQRFGMDETLGLAQTGPDGSDPFGRDAFGDAVGGQVHAAVNKILKASMERTEARLRAGADRHQAMIDALMEKETLSADEIEAIAHPKAK